LLRLIKNRLRSLVAPAIFLGITWYFGWNALHGTRGLEAQRLQLAALAQAQQSFAVIDAQRSQWETKVADLNSQSIAPDMLDEQSREVSNLADPADLEVQLPPLAPPKPGK
jgi:cell division protein FtsB